MTPEDLAALHARTTDPILVVMPADHVIADQAAFASALRQALRHAEQGHGPAISKDNALPFCDIDRIERMLQTSVELT